MTMQSIFNKFGSNWTHASIDEGGSAWLHTSDPRSNTAPVLYWQPCARCEAFDVTEMPKDKSIVPVWERTDFTNGPSYATDRFGIALHVPAALPQPAPPPMAPPAAVTLTTDQAENGELWAFANHDENYVSVNSFGVVWFDLFKDGPKPRRSYAVEVSGAVNPIERVRSQPVAPAEAGVPFAPAPMAPARSLPVCHAHGCFYDAAVGDKFCAEHAAPKLPVYPIFHPHNVIQYADEIYVWHDESGLLGGVGYSLDDANAQMGRYAESLEAPQVDMSFPSLALNKAKAHARHLLLCCEADNNTQSLTTTQYTAIFGELPQ